MDVSEICDLVFGCETLGYRVGNYGWGGARFALRRVDLEHDVRMASSPLLTCSPAPRSFGFTVRVERYASLYVFRKGDHRRRKTVVSPSHYLSSVRGGSVRTLKGEQVSPKNEDSVPV